MTQGNDSTEKETPLGYISIDNFADLFQKTPRRIRQLIAEGELPKAEKGIIPLVPACRAYAAYLEKLGATRTLMEERARLARIQADTAALHYEELRRRLVPTKVAATLIGEIVAHIKGTLIATTGKVMTQLPIAPHDRAKAEAAHRAIVDEALNYIADFDCEAALLRNRRELAEPVEPSADSDSSSTA